MIPIEGLSGLDSCGAAIHRWLFFNPGVLISFQDQDQHWNGVGSFNPSFFEQKHFLSDTVNTTIADGLATQGAVHINGVFPVYKFPL